MKYSELNRDPSQQVMSLEDAIASAHIGKAITTDTELRAKGLAVYFMLRVIAPKGCGIAIDALRKWLEIETPPKMSNPAFISAVMDAFSVIDLNSTISDQLQLQYQWSLGTFDTIISTLNSMAVNNCFSAVAE